ncbi:MAG TPA: PadR family transcriptional regulator [Gemmatimonadaceae bacterium]|jgi:transcriptional regulator|nr:PadR family transcriptional regulator [Gemmatimonadaceae bacterium]
MLFGLLPGTLDVLVLKAIEDGPNHGYGIAKWVREATDAELVLEDGALYTALHRLEHRGLLRADWKPSETKRRAKYYTLTVKGRRALDQQVAAWRRSAATLSKVLNRQPRKASS